MESKDRVRTLLCGKLPDRPPFFDLLRNDEALQHMAGEKFHGENKLDVVCKAMAKCLDATRPAIAVPNDFPREEILSGGRKRVIRRWTIWTEPKMYSSVAEFVNEKRNFLNSSSWDWTDEDEKDLDRIIKSHVHWQKLLGDVFLFWKFGGGTGLYSLCNEVGLEQLSYFLYDCPELIDEILEFHTVKAIQRIEHFPEELGADGMFIAEDIACKGSTLFSLEYLRGQFIPRLARIVEACHNRGYKVLFHSDGNLMSVLDDLVSTGIDALNPIEIAAGMDIGRIHKRHPLLILVGGVDVSQLLLYGTPLKIKATIRRAIEDSEGMIMVGSSTELGNDVPLRNFLTMYETINEYRY